jgi:CBS domain-containing protein
VNISASLAATAVVSLDLTRHVAVGPDSSVEDTVRAMSAAGRSCACIVDGGELLGIFTQRDVLMRVLGRSTGWGVPIGDEMTRSLRTMRSGESVSDGLAIMNDWWVRSVPVLDDDDQFVGNLSFYSIMSRIADLVDEHLGDVDQEVSDSLGLTLIDFTGLHTSAPMIVSHNASVEVAAHHMKARGIGSVLVADDSDHLVGVVTEFDLQTKVGCDYSDLSALTVSQVMTADPIALAARSPIAEAIRQMADRGFSHLPLLGESGRPVAVVSFRDIAGYVEASFSALG